MNDMDIVSFAGFGIAVVGAWLLAKIGKRGSRPFIINLMMVGLLAASTAISFAAWRRMYMPSLSFSSGSAVGVVMKSEIQDHQPTRKTGSTPLSGYVYDVMVHYQFEADGSKWVGHGVPPSARDLPKKSAAKEKLKTEFAKGSKVTIYYDPADPYRSSLDQIETPKGQIDLSTVHGIIMILVGLSAIGVGYSVFISKGSG